MNLAPGPVSGPMNNASNTKARTTPAPPMMSGVALALAETPRAMSKMMANSTKMVVTPEPMGAVSASACARASTISSSVRSWACSTATGCLDGLLFGDGRSQAVLTVQFDHRGLALLGNVGAQAGHFATIGEVRHRERLAADQTATHGKPDRKDQTKRRGNEPGQAALASNRF
jgi:hypothetical protein